ncbi:MAG TPA: hypothetical protein VFC61_05110 [Blastocatellia bacterium]|jgi:hypothetical protein|nr:hypothetical protein [Blastocatellia bacterium]
MVVSKERARGGRARASEVDECEIIRRYPLMYLATVLAGIALFLLFLATSPSAA